MADSGGWERMLQKDYGAWFGPYIQITNGDKLQGGFYDGAARNVTGTVNVPIGEPLLGIFTYDKAVLRLYENGREVNTTNQVSAIGASTDAWQLGRLRDSGAYYYSANARYHMAAAWDRVLTPAEIWSLNADPFQLFRYRVASVPATFAAGGMTTIRLDWTDVSENEDGFSIERATDAGAFGEIDTVGAGVETYDDLLLPTGHTYHYRVRATSVALGNSEYSNEADVTV